MAFHRSPKGGRNGARVSFCMSRQEDLDKWCLPYIPWGTAGTQPIGDAHVGKEMIISSESPPREAANQLLGVNLQAILLFYMMNRI